MEAVELTVYYSGGQLNIYDKNATRQPKWTKQLSDQGFARVDDYLCLATIGQCGDARLKVLRAAYDVDSAHVRVISVPFQINSGVCCIEGLDDPNSPYEIQLQAGSYRLVAAQTLLPSEDDIFEPEIIELYFDPAVEKGERCRIIRADMHLDPPAQLLELAECY